MLIRPSVLLAATLAALPIHAQRVTEADYARAESMLAPATSLLVDHAISGTVWTDSDMLRFTDTTHGKPVIYEIDPAIGKKRTVDTGAAARRDPSLSPDGKTTLFIRDWNLFARDVKTGKERQLTSDGTKDYGYATDNAGWKHTDQPIVLWSPDSSKIATFRQDQRKTGEMYLVSTQVGHPKLETWKYPMPGDKDVTLIERVVVDAKSGAITKLKMAPDQHRSTLCDDVRCGSDGWDDVQWSPDAKQLAFASSSRDHKDVWLRVANVEDGNVRTVLTEHVPTFYESGMGLVNWRYLWKSNEVLWPSERDGWAQLYLYDGVTGKLKNQVTHGDGNVMQVRRVDEEARSIFFVGGGKEAGRQPYYAHFYSVGFDGGNQKLLSPEDANHAITLSHNGKFFVDSYSTVTEPPVTVLRDAKGTTIAELGRTDIDRLVKSGWVKPEPFTVKARDGKTDLYGILWKPSKFDATKKYPIITYVYPGPMGESISSFGFSASTRDNQSLAELGFVVMAVNGMGTEFRSKKFHDFYFGNMGDNTLPDQVTAVKQLAAKYPWIDIDRAAIWGHSGGGYATADAMFRYPDFYKVGISESGNHDNRTYEDDWAEKWVGLLEGANYESQANWPLAKNLKGHLLLMHGTMDDNVPPNNTLLVVDALIKANKDFDLIMVPNAHHGYGEASNYAMRRRWDYFVRYLLNTEPPHEFPMKPAAPPTRRR